MDDKKRQQYYILFEKMIDASTTIGPFSREAFVQILKEICELFHIAKGVTEFYRSPGREKAGEGDILIDHDNGRGEKEVLKKRVNSRTGAVIIGTLYMAKEDSLDEEELEKVDLILRSLLSFVGRNRMIGAIEQLGFYDDAMYPNFRSFSRYLEKLQDTGVIGGYTAVRYNLKSFSVVNQDIGRANGDVAMQRYFDLVKSIIDEDGIVCRMGGDNFIGVFKDELTRSIVEVMRGIPIVYDKEQRRRVTISASIGLYNIPADFGQRDLREVLDCISAAETVAKSAEAGSVIFYDQMLRKQKEDMMRIRHRFPAALGNGEFEVYYQPKVNVVTGQIVGAEALCRWIRDGRIISPMQFIPVLELSTEICDLDFFVLDRVCKDLAKWIREYGHAVPCSVNLSRKHLIDADLLEHVLEIIDRNGVPHELLEMELTETTTDVKFMDLRRVSQGMRDEGIRTAVDDFGMGYSSLNLIREISWDVLKIDRGFVPLDEEGTDSITYKMFRHVVSMAKDIDLDCIIEGVETPYQIKLLRENNCEIAQGFYFDKPLPREEFEKRLLAGKYPLPD
ncbi:MAG: GGDEF domain-containing phosphodiesterase [Lachnospiraceae bacterium]|nr:GGDEF domain-containing phosphodiesterase [Lachnospiraceae bacterium]